MKRYVVLNKNIGETPLAAVIHWKAQNAEYAPLRASYAGRLDPMASGKLLVLLGEECKRQSAYTSLDKEYEIEVLLGMDSDTGDVLGLPGLAPLGATVNTQRLSEALQKERGAHMRTYPAFSSKTVNGKPLFLHTLEGGLKGRLLPEHIEHLYRITAVSQYEISQTDLEEKIEILLQKVPRTTDPSKKLGKDFRVNEVRDEWKSLFKKVQGTTFIVLRLKVTCASGTYMRSLAARIGVSLSTRGLALSITRTKIGRYISLGWGMGFWVRTYNTRNK